LTGISPGISNGRWGKEEAVKGQYVKTETLDEKKKSKSSPEEKSGSRRCDRKKKKEELKSGGDLGGGLPIWV